MLYYRIIDSILDAAHQNGFECITMEIPRRHADIDRIIQSFIGLHVDGLVIVSTPMLPPDVFKRLAQAGIPVTSVERGYMDQAVDNFIVEDFAAAYDAVQRIAAKGHRRIALTAARTFAEVEKQRLAGYRQAIADTGCDMDEELLYINDYSRESGFAAAEKFLALKNPPTAIFATADTLAAGVLQALHARGLRVPDDISLVGYDDVLSQTLAPQLDSVGLILEDTGAQAIELLVGRMDNPERAPEVRPIHTVYIERGSVKNLCSLRRENG